MWNTPQVTDLFNPIPIRNPDNILNRYWLADSKIPMGTQGIKHSQTNIKKEQCVWRSHTFQF